MNKASIPVISCGPLPGGEYHALTRASKGSGNELNIAGVVGGNGLNVLDVVASEKRYDISLFGFRPS